MFEDWQYLLAAFLLALPFIILGIIFIPLLLKSAKGNAQILKSRDVASSKSKQSKLISIAFICLTTLGLLLLIIFGVRGGPKGFDEFANPYLFMQAGILIMIAGIVIGLVNVRLKK